MDLHPNDEVEKEVDPPRKVAVWLDDHVFKVTIDNVQTSEDFVKFAYQGMTVALVTKSRFLYYVLVE